MVVLTASGPASTPSEAMVAPIKPLVVVASDEVGEDIYHSSMFYSNSFISVTIFTRLSFCLLEMLS